MNGSSCCPGRRDSFLGEPETVVMRPGDFVLITAHRRHRVEWTDRDQKTIWLALHYSDSDVLQGSS